MLQIKDKDRHLNRFRSLYGITRPAVIIKGRACSNQVQWGAMVELMLKCTENPLVAEVGERAKAFEFLNKQMGNWK